MNLIINKLKIRKNFSKHNQTIYLSNLLDIQKTSFNKFINYDNNGNSGINDVLNSIFPIFNYNKNIKLEYINYELHNENLDYNDCKFKGITYCVSIKLKLKLITYDKNNNIINDIIQNVYIGDIPIMTENASFIINGIEKVIVSQLHRSPGIFFDYIKDKINISNKLIYNARIIPYRGSWLDFEFDHKDHIFARIDRKKKFPFTVFFHAFNFSNNEIIKIFCDKILIKIINNNFYIDILKSKIINKKLDFNINIKELKINNNTIINEYYLNKILENNLRFIKLEKNYIIGKVLYDDIYNNNVIIAKSNDIINNSILDNISKNNIEDFNIIYSNKDHYGIYVSETLRIDNTNNYKSAINEISKIIRPGEFQSFQSSEYLFKNLFFSNEKYDLSKIGRIKINESINSNSNNLFLDKYDFINIIKKLIEVKNNKKNIDDIDNLSNRRIKSVGEMIENQFKLGLLRIEKNIKEKLSINNNITNFTPQKIISNKQLSSIIKDFFNSSQLSQFMDQNNPLAEITHKRRISSLGPGGLTRERAGFEVRDVHPTHYGKLCPIETPEGPNIGLINSLSIYSKINDYGFLETPYYLVKNKIITNEIHYISSVNEFNYIIAQQDIKNIKDNILLDDYIMCRYKGEFNLFKSNLVNYIDVSKQQIVSIGSSLIPFLEHNDANRALMGSNMQRQAVPLIKSESPIVGTGMEYKVAIDSNYSIPSKRSGLVIYLDSNKIIIKVNDNEINENDINDFGFDIYNLKKFIKSNQNTCINYTPSVNLNSYVNKNDIISDSQSTNLGELALGKNIKVAFMSWYGYNFEDSMIISERLIKDNIFTSIHIQEFVCIIRDTKLGKEEITSDIPSVSERLLSKLDKNGIIHMGSYVNQGDILVGKVTPKGETQLTPEEKLLRAIFGEKVSDVKDSSLRVPNGISGKVIDIKIFNKDFHKKNNSIDNIENEKLEKFIKSNNEEKIILKSILFEKIKNIILNNNINLDIKKINKIKNIDYINNISNKYKLNNYLFKFISKYNNLDIFFKNKLNNFKKKINNYLDLSPGILKIIKVYIAVKKYIQTGDKIAGRHGNKGVISKINAIEDMPYDINGESIDIILNPLGVPSRMNIGQILEAHLGLASKSIGKNIEKIIKKNISINSKRRYLNIIFNDKLKTNKNINFNKFSDLEINNILEELIKGINISTPVFDGISELEIKKMLNISNIDTSGQIYLYDGLTGERFDRKITVGYIYMMKLNHLVDDKMHARSIGSYSLITQQPLGGKSQFGGQRFGEMEVWALEAYGAAYTLQEMLTVKSDDVDGRINMYNNIIYGNNKINIGIPESFNVLFKEIRSLCINIELIKK